MMQYSKSPWKYRRIKEDNNQVVGFMVCSGDGSRIVNFDLDEYGYGNEEEVMANAKLISVAPELYEALEDLVNQMPKGSGLQYFHAKQQVIKARALISKLKEL